MEYRGKWAKQKLQIQTDKDTHECPICAHHPASKRYNYPVYGDPDNPGLVTSFFSSKLTREELGLKDGGKLISIRAKGDLDVE